MEKTMTKHNCEQCKKEFNLDEGFLDIAEICEGTHEAMDYFEEKSNLDLSNFWCISCAGKTLRDIENYDQDYDPEPDYDAKTAEETAHEQYEIYTTLK
jgi:hypothetical protein